MARTNYPADTFFEPVTERRAWHLPLIVTASALAALAASYSRTTGGTSHFFASSRTHASIIQAESFEDDSISQHDDLLASLTERAEREADPQIIAELKPTLIELGHTIDAARIAQRTASPEFDARLRAMEAAGRRTLALMARIDRIDQAVQPASFKIAKSAAPDSGPSLRPRVDVRRVSSDR